MITGMYSAATGMNAQQHKLDTIANNLANVDTTGFKKSRNEFADLFYVYAKQTGSPESDISGSEGPVYTGLGVREVRTTRLYTQGNIEKTERPLDVAINGQGFFRVILDNGGPAYTRDGAFHEKDGTLYTSAGHAVDGVSVDGVASVYDLIITQDGFVTDSAGVNYGQIALYDFTNPEGLKSIGDNLYLESDQSGEVNALNLGLVNTTLAQGFLEKSNVNAVQEMVNMISAQRAYELNSKSITTADNMLQTVNGLKR
ncbi:MAG TPA: flagellar basal-body rod protein FlgG [Thermotogota bacterium]|nr:flagellar basal-body rod protein FlgG [Thermotogota bacterium]